MRARAARGKSTASQCARLRVTGTVAEMRPPYYGRMQRRGHTLIELALVLALLGILLGLAVPHLTASLDGIHAGQAASRIALAHGRARATALREQRVAAREAALV